MKAPTQKKLALAIGLLVTTFSGLIYLDNPAPIRELELVYQRAQFAWRGPLNPGNEVVIAAIDEKSLDRFGRWPWPRSVFGDLVRKLNDLNAAVVAFDVVFSFQSQNQNQEEWLHLKNQLEQDNLITEEGTRRMEKMIAQSDQDRRLREVLHKLPTLVLGYFFHFDPRSVPHLTQEIREEEFQNIRPSRFRGFVKSSEDLDLGTLDIKPAYAVETNSPTVARSTRRQGFFNFDVERDGSLRRQPLLIRYTAADGRKYFFPSLAIKSVETYLNGTLLFRVGESGVEQVLVNGEQSLSIPTNPKGELSINYLGPRNTFPHISVADILSSSGSSMKSEIAGKVVLIGATATAMEDFRRSPFDPVLPGVEIHATVIDNLLHGNSLYEPGWMPLIELVYLVASGLLLTILFAVVHPLIGLGIGVAFSLFQFFGVQWVMTQFHIWSFGVLPTLQCFTILGMVIAKRYIFEEKQKRQIRSIFNQYVSPRVIDQLIHHPQGLKLGGEQKELTALFTDLEGFTTISETMSAEDQVTFLNEFLGEMTHILLKHDGTLDKYDGDAIKAFFGAPLYFEDHARRACTVAIEMQQRLAELRRLWKEQGKPEMYMRVGVNTGMMVVGNLGSSQRMNYGMNGDAVNLAARLEGVNKFYKTHTIISESTYNQVQDAFEVRKLDTILVVGRNTPVTIFELLGAKGEVSPETMKLLYHFDKGKAFYLARDWPNAIREFEMALGCSPEDGPSRVFLQRCKDYSDTPPPQNWGGIHSMTAK